MQDFACLAKKTAVVTGASSGIGRAIAIEFAKAGANLIIHYSTSEAQAQQVVDQIRTMGRAAHLLQANFQDRSAVDGLIEKAWQLQGGFDIWVNNAGVDVLTGPAADWTYEQKLQQLLEIDVRANLLIAKSAGERMYANQQGTLLTIGWDQADRGMEGNSGELFAATKNAVMGFTRSLALSLAPFVRVNCIAPGWIKTAWGETASENWQQRVLRETPMGRWGLPQDIANYARFLCSDAASYVTGQIINVNGGAVR